MQGKVYPGEVMLTAVITYRDKSGEWAWAVCQDYGIDRFVHIHELGSIHELNGRIPSPLIELDDSYKQGEVPAVGTIIRYVPGDDEPGACARVWVVNEDYLTAQRRMKAHQIWSNSKLEQLRRTVMEEVSGRLNQSIGEDILNVDNDAYKDLFDSEMNVGFSAMMNGEFDKKLH